MPKYYCEESPGAEVFESNENTLISAIRRTYECDEITAKNLLNNSDIDNDITLYDGTRVWLEK